MNIRPILFILLFSLLSAGTVKAQQRYEISGRVLEKQSKQPIEFATVLIGDKESQKAITGITTTQDGTFSIEIDRGNFYIEISFIGFETVKVEEIDSSKSRIDLGDILLEENVQNLDEVTVVTEKSQTQFKLDKRIFNVGKDLSSSGASALEVLNNVPSVNVNIEGQISLRGSQGVQILINGKPSVLANDGGNALGTITADIIDRIEVITNPSAKYDAEGTSGIINIVLKKEERRGLNGSVTLNTGVPNNHSLGLSLNKRTEKFNLFSQLGIGRRTFPEDTETINRDLVNNTFLSAFGEEEKNETFYNLILGVDYLINDSNIITLSGNYAFEEESESSENNYSFSENDVLSQQWTRRESTEATNPKWQYELQYKRDFKRHEDQDLLFSALGSFFGKDQSSLFQDMTTFGIREDFMQQTRTDFKEARYTFKLDYTHPFAEKYTIETGAQYVLNDVSNDYEVSDFINGGFVANPDFTNIFDFNQNVLGVYTTAAYEADKWGIKAGLRLENTDLKTLLRTTNARNNQNYTNLFPSIHTSYKLTEDLSVQAGYSRRIYRPRLWDLNPFFTIRDNFNISTGNPNLDPEFTDSYEITTIYKLRNASLNFGVYHRYTTDVIEDVITFLDNVSTRMPLNIGTNNTTGVEFNAKYTPVNWATITTDFNYNYFKREGDFQNTSFDFEGDRWSSRMTAKFKLPAQIDLEVSGNYRSRFITFQSEVNDNIFANLGVRKKIFKGKAILNLSVRDVFASRVFLNETSQPNFFLRSRGQRGRFVTFGISYGFGKGEAMEFSGQKRF
ncbi:TonB-dependent receptor [Leptobacterium flavescens]|uniref:TonB-dependent receptor n=1 Tax=Leptobacterium flavescens TaxID=472055 RepID=A0A6P0UXF2_9FLAO|nr:outer membrane beta-barrel family protein [Leptobacterium flavescens]NER15363.1 TonB-dependent receptor [Leptobacterium flavescens]